MNDNVVIEKKTTMANTKSRRRKLFNLHSWVGFHLAFIMSVVLATGTIATVSNEIDWLTKEELRVTPGDVHVPWQTMTNAIEAYLPDSTILTISSLEGDYLAHRARVKDLHGNQQYIYVDQWTGKVTGTTGLLTVQRFFRDLHRYMFMPNVLGLPVVTSMAFILAISLYTGLKTSRNWKTLMTRIRITKGTRVFIGDAHKAFGLWAVWFLVLMIITSLWYLVEFGAAVGKVRFEPNRPFVSVEQLQSFGDVIKTPTTADIITATNLAFPELNITSINFPTRVNQPITILGETGNPILRARANRVFLNPQSLEPLIVQRSQSIGWVAWLNEIADPLHFGFFGGLITKLIWFIFGLALTSLSLTGVWLTWKRTKTKSISKAQLATMPILLIALLFSYFWWYQRYLPPLVPYSEIPLVSMSDGAVTVRPMLGLSKDKPTLGHIRFLIHGDRGRPNLKTISASLYTHSADLIKNKKVSLARLSDLSIAKVNFSSDNMAKANTIILYLELNSGRQITLTWPLKKTTLIRKND